MEQSVQAGVDEELQKCLRFGFMRKHPVISDRMVAFTKLFPFASRREVLKAVRFYKSEILPWRVRSEVFDALVCQSVIGNFARNFN